MQIELKIEAEKEDLENILRMVLMGQISDADVVRAKQREERYKSAETNARVSKLYLEAHNRERRKHLEKNE